MSSRGASRFATMAKLAGLTYPQPPLAKKKKKNEAMRRTLALLLLGFLASCGGPQPESAANSPSGASADGADAAVPDWQSLQDADLDTVGARADQNDRVAQYELGVRYSQGRGVDKNPFTAVEWFRRSADQGLPQAQFELGSAHLLGEGAPPDIAEATRWYREAAPSMVEAEAAASYLESVRAGNEKDELRRGMWLYADGELDPALEALVLLAEGRNTTATYFVGTIARDIEDEQDDELHTESVRWHRQAADAGFVWSQYELGDLYLDRAFAGDEEHPEEAREALRWYRAAGAQGLDLGEAGVEVVLGLFPALDSAASEAQPAAVERTPDGGAACERMVGRWQWYTNDISGVLTFDTSNNVGAAPTVGMPQVLNGRWGCDPQTGVFTISWQNNVVESYTMATDGASISGRNNLGMAVRGTPLR
jgi:TPR repeat protein